MSEHDFIDVSQLTPADFEAQVGTEFGVDLSYFGLALDGSPLKRDDVYPSAATILVRLTEVTRRDAVSPDTRQDPFVLLFRGSHEASLLSGVHMLSHASLGRFAVLLTPVQVSLGTSAEAHPEGRFYESVFN